MSTVKKRQKGSNTEAAASNAPQTDTPTAKSSSPLPSTSPPAPSATENDAYEQLIQHIVDIAPSQLSPTEYVHEELHRRFSVVHGRVLLHYLSQKARYDKLSSSPTLGKVSEFSSLCELSDYSDMINTFLQRQYIVRVSPKDINKRRMQASQSLRITFAPKEVQVYDDDGLYAFLIPPSPSHIALIKSCAVIVLILALCMFKIWPIICRIILWWILLFTTCFLIALLLLHWTSSLFFWCLGFSGWAFMPNLSDDEISFFQTFTPIFGAGGEHRKRWALERELQIKARNKLRQQNQNNGIASAESTIKAVGDELNPLSVIDEAIPDNLWYSATMGAITVGVLGCLGAFATWHFGLFSPDLVPEFIVNGAEMYSLFPSLAPPPENSQNEDGSDDSSSGDLEEIVSRQDNIEIKKTTPTSDDHIGSDDDSDNISTHTIKKSIPVEKNQRASDEEQLSFEPDEVVHIDL